jgi:hypothetical protein
MQATYFIIRHGGLAICPQSFVGSSGAAGHAQPYDVRKGIIYLTQG